VPFPTLPGFDKQAFDKYLRNTGWLMFGKVLNMAVGFATTRYLGAGQFGDLSTAIALTTILAAVSMLGLDSFIIREILHDPHKRDEILGTSFWLRIAFSAGMVPATVGGYMLFRNLVHSPGNLLSPMIAILSVASVFKSFNVIDSFFQSKVESKYVVHIQNSSLLLSSAVKIWLVLSGAGVIWFAWALLFDAMILACGLLFIYRKKGYSTWAWTVSAARARTLLSQSWPLIISAVMVSLYMKIDVLMLKAWRGSEEVGSYSVAANISESWYFIPVAIVTSVFPAIIHARSADPEKYRRRLQNLYDLLVAISLPTAIVIGFCGDSIIQFIYQDRFPGAGLMLSIHIWSGIFVFLGTASSQYLLAEGLTRISFIRTGIGAVVNILLNIWLIPEYGGVGASIATLAAYFIATFSAFFYRRLHHQGVMMIKSLFLISLFEKLRKREV
jgi:O-antigen/teichoic acid export membrane protein